MKIPVTRKETLNWPRRGCYQCGYCAAGYILHGLTPDAYNRGVYGWNYDAYRFNGVLIATGYRNMPGPTIPGEMLDTYNARARDIMNGPGSYGECAAAMDALRAEFADALYSLNH